MQAAFPAAQLARLRHGLSLDGQALKPAQVEWQNPEQLRFVLTEGKKRQIRRMCELVGLKVVGLKRVRIGRVVLGQLPVGQWRYLAPKSGFEMIGQSLERVLSGQRLIIGATTKKRPGRALFHGRRARSERDRQGHRR